MRKVIINADDFGLSEDVNRAIDFCFRESIISSTSLLTNFSSFNSAITLAQQGSYLTSIGIHYNIVEGIPLSPKMLKNKKFCRDGVFIYKRNSAKLLSYKDVIALREECELQIKKMIDAGIYPSHIDSHMHTHTELPIFLSILPVLRKYKLNRIRRPLNYDIKYNVKWLYKLIYVMIVKLLGFKTTSKFSSYFNENASKVNCASIELMVHPDISGEVIFDSVTHEYVVKKDFSLRNDTLINYREL